MTRTYSGQIRLRLPVTLHRELAEMADEEGVSLNMFLVSLLSKGAENWHGRQEKADIESTRDEELAQLLRSLVRIMSKDKPPVVSEDSDAVPITFDDKLS